MKKAIALILYFNFIVNFVEGQTPNFPVPTNIPDQLFYLQRSPNINTVIYQLNRKDGILDSLKPVHIFWISYAEKAQREELTEIQRKLAYGLSYKRLGNETYEIRFLAQKEHAFILKKGKDNQFHVFATINNRHAILHKIFLQINGGAVFKPNIEYVMLYGSDNETGDLVTEQIRKL